jgi:hypothetical protein
LRKTLILFICLLSLIGCSNPNDSNGEVDSVPEALLEQTDQKTENYNMFDPYKVSPGDTILGLEITSIQLDTFDKGSIFIDFGEIELTGTYKHLAPDEITNQDYAIYFTVDEQSLSDLPRIRKEDMNFPVVIGIENKAAAEAALGPPGTEKKSTILVSDYKIRSAPSKPIDDAMTFVKLLQ